MRSERKTDVLNAQLLATHDLIGVWRESYLPSQDVNEVIISEYQKYDHLREFAEYWRIKAEEKVLSMEWETGSGTLSGPEMLSLLSTAPQVGTLTAITWLVHINLHSAAKRRHK